jgi:hypothetical protein
MPVRLGIEIGPIACRMVALDTRAETRLRGHETWVRAFDACASSREEIVESLAAFRGERAAVVVWGVAADHRQSLLARGSHQEMRPDALRLLDQAGIRTRRVLTPAAALLSMARLRRGPETSGTLQAYVAVSETNTAIALVRDQALLSAHELAWGYLDPERELAPRESDEIVAILAEKLGAYFKTARSVHGAVSTVVICGGVPRLRTMAAVLIERLDVKVEPLDSPFAIDLARLPANGADLRERCAEMRLAWAAAADWPAPLDLLRQQRRAARGAWAAGAAMVAGMATGLAVGFGIQSSAPFVMSAPHAAVVRAGRPRGQATRITPRTRAVPVPTPVGVRAPIDPPLTAADFVRSYEPLPSGAAASPAPARVESSASRRAVPGAPPAPADVRPFKAEVRTILYAPERKLAFIDGQIVEPGDSIHGARVLDITPTTVVVEDRTGARIELRVGDVGH